MIARKSHRNLGGVLIGAGVGVWVIGAALYAGNVSGLFPTIPYAGTITTAIGAFAESVGFSLLLGLPVIAIEQRRTSLVLVIPALLLFLLMLLAAALMVADNFGQPTSPGRWLGTAVFLLVSIGIVSALIREVLSRFVRVQQDRPEQGVLLP